MGDFQRRLDNGAASNDLVPFSPSVSPLYDTNGALSGYSYAFNQGYVFNNMASGKTSREESIIAGMDQVYNVGENEEVSFKVDVVLNKENFLVDSKVFGTGTGQSSFPATTFQYLFDDSIEDTGFITGYYPVCKVKGGHILELELRDNIQFDKRGLQQIGATGASSEGEGGIGHIIIESGRDDETLPTRFRAISGGSGIQVRYDDTGNPSGSPYIVIDTTNQGLGNYVANTSITGGSTGARIYITGTNRPQLLRELTGAAADSSTQFSEIYVFEEDSKIVLSGQVTGLWTGENVTQTDGATPEYIYLDNTGPTENPPSKAQFRGIRGKAVTESSVSEGKQTATVNVDEVDEVIEISVDLSDCVGIGGSAATNKVITGSLPTGSIIVGGAHNSISGHFNVISAGSHNKISGNELNFIGGGSGNDVTFSRFSSSLGGENNDISGSNRSVVLGGRNNLIHSGGFSFLGGGDGNKITGSQSSYSSIIGGGGNLITGLNSVLAGGNVNSIFSDYSFIGGGESNIASGEFSIIAGGEENKTFSTHSVVLGGQDNTASGIYSFVGAGKENKVLADYGFAAGRNSTVQENHDGAFVLSDSNTTETLSSGANTLTLNFKSGVFVDSDSGIYINGNPVLTGVSGSEGDTLQIVTDRGATTTNDITAPNLFVFNNAALKANGVGYLELGNTGGGVIQVGGDGVNSTIAPRFNNLKIQTSRDSDDIIFLAGASTTELLRLDASASSINVPDNVQLNIGAGIDLIHNSTNGFIKNTVGDLYIENTTNGKDTIFKNDNDSGTATELLRLDGSASSIKVPDDVFLQFGSSNDLQIYHTTTTNQSWIYNSQGHLKLTNAAINSDIVFSCKDATTVNELMRLDGSTSNVGIGTSVPSGKLDVNGAIHARGGTVAGNTGESDTTNAAIVLQDNNYIYGQTSNNYLRRIIGKDSAGVITVGQGETSIVKEISFEAGNHSDGKYTFHSGTTELARIQADGNMGIGTDSPSARLHVNGPAAGFAEALRLQRAGGNYYSVGLDNSRVNFVYNSQTTANSTLTIDGGNTRVGIGTHAPSRHLHVEGGGTNVLANFESTDAGAYLSFSDDSTTNDTSVRLGAVGNNFQFFTNGSEQVRITSSGNVGIGTDNPVYTLEVDVDNDDWVRFKSNDNKMGLILADNDTVQYLMAENSALSLGHRAALHNENLNIIDGGDVGIGTTTPSGKLHVFNTGNASGDIFIVDGSHGRLFNVSDETTGIIFSVNDAAGLPVLEVDSTSGYDKISIGEFGTNALVVSGSTSTFGGDVLGTGAGNRITNNGTPYLLSGDAAATLTLQDVTDNGNTTTTGVTIGSSQSPYADSDGNGGERKLFVDGGDLAIDGGKYIALDHSYRVHGYLRYDSSLTERKFVHYGYYGHTLSTRSKSNALVIRGDSPKIGFNESDPISELHLYNHGNSGASIMTIQNGSTAEGSWGGIQFINSTFDYPRSAIFSQRTGGAYNADLTFHATTTNEITGAAYPYASERMRIKSDGNVGIGTNNPQRKLDVRGTAGVQYAPTAHDTQGAIFLLADGSNNSYIELRDGSSNVDVKLNTAGDSYFNGGNVGIGTTSPSAPLHIQSSTDHNKIRLTNDNSQTWGLMIGNSGYYQGYFMIDQVGSGQRFVINDQGSVGIGTNAPSEKLHVDEGFILADGASTNHGFELRRDSSDTFQIRHLGGNFTINNLTDNRKDLSIDGNGNVGIGTDIPSEKLTVDGNIRINGDSREFYFAGNQAQIRASSASTDITFVNSSTELVRFASDGKVGINDTAPQGKLQIDAGGDVNCIHLVNSSQSFSNFATRPISIIFGDEQKGASARHQASINCVREAWSNTPAALTFKTAAGVNTATERMRITSAGNVGIGTDNPQELLHIDGSSPRIRLRDSDAAGTPYAHIDASDGALLIEADKGDETASSYIALTVDGSESIRAIAGGNVGIGTSSPTTTLDVYKSSSTSATSTGTTLFKLHNYVGVDLNQQKSFIDFALTDDNTNETPQVRIGAEVGQNGNADSQIKEGCGAFVVYTNNAEHTTGDAGASLEERMRVDYQGKVGIGTTNPAFELDVDGTIHGTSGNFENGITIDGNPVLTGTSPFETDTLQTVTDRGATTTNAISIHNSAAGGNPRLSVGRETSQSIEIDVDDNNNTIVARQDTDSDQDHKFVLNRVFGGTGENDFQISKAGTAQLTIDTDGKVGIGTTNPSQRLHVNSSAINEVAIFESTDGTAYISIQDSGTSTGLHGYGAIGDNLTLYASGAERVRIASDGKVGIGSKNPSFVLDTVFTGDNGARLRSTDNHSSLTVHSHPSYGAYLRFMDGSNRYWLQARSDDKLHFRPNATLLESASIYFDETGKVGIGVSNPTEKLEINPDTDVSAIIGKAHVGYMGQADSAFFGHINYANTSNYALKQNNLGNTFLNCKTAGTIAFNINNATIAAFDNGGDFQVDTDTLFVDASEDRVGIGTQTPSGTLHVSSNFTNVFIQDANSSYPTAAALINFNDNGTQGIMGSIGYETDGNLTISQRNPSRYIALTGSNVGIGTTSPSTPLHVKGNIRAEASASTAFADFKSSQIYASSTYDVIVGSSNSLHFRTDDTRRMTILGDGKVGIGTTIPSNALDVVGHFSATSKSFLIDHPTKENKKLQYASLEGPENGVYVRGTTNSAIIELPDYWSALVHEDSITVVLTPIGKKQDLYIKSKSPETVMIGGVEGSYDYVVYGERKDIDRLEIEPDGN